MSISALNSAADLIACDKTFPDDVCGAEEAVDFIRAEPFALGLFDFLAVDHEDDFVADMEVVAWFANDGEAEGVLTGTDFDIACDLAVGGPGRGDGAEEETGGWLVECLAGFGREVERGGEEGWDKGEEEKG